MELSKETEETIEKLKELGSSLPPEQALCMTIGISYDELADMHCDMCRALFMSTLVHQSVTSMLHNFNMTRRQLDGSRH